VVKAVYEIDGVISLHWKRDLGFCMRGSSSNLPGSIRQEPARLVDRSHPTRVGLPRQKSRPSHPQEDSVAPVL
jgi:hypothetical protein